MQVNLLLRSLLNRFESFSLRDIALWCKGKRGVFHQRGKGVSIHLNLLAVHVDFLKLAKVVLIESAGDIHESIFEHVVVFNSSLNFRI